MTRLELLTVFRSLKKLNDKGMPEAAFELIDEIIAEAEGEKRTKSEDTKNS